VRRLLDGLLDLCDWLSAKDPASALAFADDYGGQEEWPRAQRMLQDQVARFPDRADLLGRYGMLARRAGDLATAQEACLEAIRIDPQRADFQLELARVALDRLELPASRSALQAALALDPAAAGAAALGVRIMALAEALQRAAVPGGWPQWTLSPDERARGRLAGDTLALVVHLFREHGVVQLDAAFDADTIGALHEALRQSHPPLFLDDKTAEAARAADKRRVSTVTLGPVLGAPEFVASGLWLPVMKQVLGQECILGAYAAEVSLPGSTSRSPRRESAVLFPQAGGSLALPPVAARVIVPLVRMDATTGTTRIFMGTRAASAAEAAELAGHDPVLPAGSCLLLDQALVVQRLANTSVEAQPVLSLVFSRPWYRDPDQGRQAPLRFAPAYFERASAELRQLVGWWGLELRRVGQALGQASA
jgi:tetratricopeptide (TPR) repeat protein